MNRKLSLLGTASIALLLAVSGANAQPAAGQAGNTPGMMTQGGDQATSPPKNDAPPAESPSFYPGMMGYGGPGTTGAGWMGPGMMGGYGPSPWTRGRGWAGPENRARGYGPGPWMMGGGWAGPGMMGGYGPGPWMMGGGWAGPGMMGGYGPGPWMMGGGWTRPGMTGGYGPGPWMMGGGWMGPNMMGWGGIGPYASGALAVRGNLDLTVSQVERQMGRWLAITGNPHVKLGKVAEQKDGSITVDIVTTDNGGLVQRYIVNRNTGFLEPAGE
ncbi:hypothetical protein [Acidiphilium multivorum]|uniref:hypothetical protein n=1 Tax=Acidiphilium multivorum TaxID=62140 RepID=UPI001B8AF27B|nr:hypothetical protein [Acidiphilium multivorum]MBS3024973.1 hypothetical protein [Acidiphilium multivorum]